MQSSCLCGDVRWNVDAAPVALTHCHCGRCRKQHGTPFATHGMTPSAGFQLASEASVATWESSQGFARRFCKRCGSAVPAAPRPGEAFVFLPAGNFDDDLAVRPSLHIFVASKAPWYEIPDSLPRFDAYPPGVEGSVLPDPPLAPRPAGKTRGSCNCGAVAFEYEGEPILCRNCHCLRCRKARSAAHASNLGVRVAQLRFTRGEDRLRSYKIPEAKFFTQVFCNVCGSKAPRVDPSRDLAVVPLGSLDDDPGVKPREHIFVGSKAPWFEIADSLPQYAEAAPV
jgi:hypothetical protein